MTSFDMRHTPKTPPVYLTRRLLPTVPSAPLKASAILAFQNPALRRPILTQQSQAQAVKGLAGLPAVQSTS